MSAAWKRAVHCGTCGARVKRSGHTCGPAPGGPVDADVLLEEIRGLRRANKAHVDLAKRQGRIGTHPRRRKRRA